MMFHVEVSISKRPFQLDFHRDFPTNPHVILTAFSRPNRAAKRRLLFHILFQFHVGFLLADIQKRWMSPSNTT
jgi:hypothetical protein